MLIKSEVSDKVENQLYKVFKALGEPTRLRIIKMLSVQELCVCELSETLDMLQPRVSQHLKILKEAGLIKEKKEGYWVCHSLNRGMIDQVYQDFKFFLDADLKLLEGFGKEARLLEGLPGNKKIKKIKDDLSHL